MYMYVTVRLDFLCVCVCVFQVFVAMLLFVYDVLILYVSEVS